MKSSPALGASCREGSRRGTLLSMSRYGTPMYAPSQHAYVFITIEEPGKTPKLKRWRGRTCKGIREKAKKFYPKDAHLGFGKCIYITD
jgi:hypothetical protein